MRSVFIYLVQKRTGRTKAVSDRTMIPEWASNADLCDVRALGKLRRISPRKFAIGMDGTCATWRNGSAVAISELTALLLSAVLKRGMCPIAYSTHSLRAWGWGGDLVILSH